MGTANFYNKNASKYFIIENNSGDEEENDFDDTLDLTIDGLKESFQELANESKRDVYFGKIDFDDNRNFSGQALCKYSDSFTFCNSNLEVSIIPIIRSGYYTGANLDYDIEFKIDYDEYTEISEVINHIREYGSNVFKLNIGNCEKRLNELESNMINEVEKVFADFTEQYQCIGRFSNGEALYEKFTDLSDKVDTPEARSKEKGIGD